MKMGYPKKNIKKIVLVLFACIYITGNLSAQGEDPPVPIDVTPVISSVAFGTFYDPGNDGGSIYINPQTDARSPSGVITMGTSYSRAEYNITGGNPGTLIVFTHSANVVLTRDGGGATIDMDIEIYPSPFMVIEDPAAENKLYIGGTLNIPAGALSGIYTSGEFQITLNQP